MCVSDGELCGVHEVDQDEVEEAGDRGGQGGGGDGGIILIGSVYNWARFTVVPTD